MEYAPADVSKGYWTKKGICWARNSEVQDINDTAMGFRILRLHGHQVSPDSQVLFQEKILEDAKNFSAKYLKKKRAANELLDKWIITNDLPGKQTLYSCGLCSGCHGMLAYPDYGGENDVWIGKTLYRMPYMTNDVYLELAKLDYNNCQAMHYDEWKEEIQRW